MKQGKISALQLFYVMIAFEVGNTVVFSLGAEAGQDAWIAILTAMLSGLVLMSIYTALAWFYPGDTLVQMIPKIIGKFFGYPLIIIYISYFIFLAGSACRDFSELIVTTILHETPLVLVVGSFMVLIVYCLRGGVEVFGRMGEMVFPIYILALVTVWLLLYGSNLVNFDRLNPVFEHDLKTVWETAFPLIVSFPFGEMVIITMFFPLLNDQRKVRRVGMAVVVCGGILLTLNTMITLSVLGPQIFSREFFPFYAAARMVSIADFLERIDTIVILMMVAGVFFKVGGWTYGAAIGTAQLLGLKRIDSVLIPIAAIITPLTIIMATNFAEHVKIGLKIVPVYLHIPLQIVIPILLLGIAITRKKLKV